MTGFMQGEKDMQPSIDRSKGWRIYNAEGLDRVMEAMRAYRDRCVICGDPIREWESRPTLGGRRVCEDCTRHTRHGSSEAA
jgi:hypothetical protein